MATIDQKKRPAILTESDRILQELQEELSDLKSRMHHLEEEQEENKDLIKQLAIYEEFTQAQAESAKKEREHHKDNYQVIGNVMQNLKSPVTNVVDNLSDLIGQIPDLDTQACLKECMDTANSVLKTFSEVEDFCRLEAAPSEGHQTGVETREFLKNVLQQAQKELDLSIPVRLMVDKLVPEESALYIETIQSALSSLLKELDFPESKELIVEIKKEQSAERVLVELFDLVVTIKTQGPCPLQWSDSWVESIQANHERMQNQGFNLLNTRDKIRNTGGSLEALTEEGKLTGFECRLPLTY